MSFDKHLDNLTEGCFVLRSNLLANRWPINWLKVEIPLFASKAITGADNVDDIVFASQHYPRIALICNGPVIEV